MTIPSLGTLESDPEHPASCGLSEDEVHAGRQFARRVRIAAYSAVRTPKWGNSLLIGVSRLEVGEIVERVRSVLSPMRRGPLDELVRVRFDTANSDPVSDDLKSAICMELEPFIVGVGEIWTEQTLEGFKVFQGDKRQVIGRHDVRS